MTPLAEMTTPTGTRNLPGRFCGKPSVTDSGVANTPENNLLRYKDNYS
jgi:hypothetical protein